MPALIGLLEDADADVRHGAAQTLGEWGHRAEAVPALIGLLGHADAEVRYGAARTLGEWGKVPDLVRSIVSPLIPDHPDPVVELLTHARDDFMPMCIESSTVQLVIRALTPDQGDTPLVTQLRRIVYQWLWQVAGVAG